MLDKMIYNTVLCQAFSPCGKYLIAGNIYGQLAIFDLDRILDPVIELLTPDYNKPKYIHEVQPGSQINSLVASEKFLIVGTVGEIIGFEFKALLASKLGKPSWMIRLPSKSAFEQLDVNSIWLSDDGEKIYVGAGDSNVYVFNLEDGSLAATLSGHEDYVHCVHGKGQQLVSASEDGTVKVWDTRTNKQHSNIAPHKDSKVARPDLGKWVGAAALGDDWIVCGGGPRLALWHLRSLDAVTVFDLPPKGVHTALFHDDCIVAGAANNLYQLSYSGEVKVEIPVSATTIYSVLMRTTPNKLLVIAGSSPNIDLCTTFNYKDQVLHFR